MFPIYFYNRIVMHWYIILLSLLSPQLIFAQEIKINNQVNTRTVLENYKSSDKDLVKIHQWIKEAIVPSTLILLGVITLIPDSHSSLSKYSIQNKVRNLFSGYSSPIDNYLQFTPLAAVYGLKVAGIKSRSSLIDQFALSVKSELLMTLIVQGMKSTIKSKRPSGGMNSMPSGHTAQAFVSATILDMEYRDTSPWISVAGYATATTTAMYRMINNKHWISDVLIGAGIGILSTKIVYFTHRYRFGIKDNVVIVPTLLNHGAGVSFAMVF